MVEKQFDLLFEKANKEINIVKKVDLYLTAFALIEDSVYDYLGSDYDGGTDKEKHEKLAAIKGFEAQLEDKISKTTNDEQKIFLYKLAIRLVDGTLGEKEFFGGNPYRDLKNGFIRVYLNRKGAEVKDLLDVIGDEMVTFQADLEGDGIISYFVINREFGVVFKDGNGGIDSLEFLTLTNTEIVKTLDIENSRRKAVLILTMGGNGEGASYAQLIGAENGKPMVIFITPTSPVESTSVGDMDNDGKIEIQTEETIEYKKLHWPSIYRWNGQTFIDSTLQYPEKIIQWYKNKINDSHKYPEKKELWDEVIAGTDEYIKGKSEQYREFWEKNLKPLKLDNSVPR